MQPTARTEGECVNWTTVMDGLTQPGMPAKRAEQQMIDTIRRAAVADSSGGSNQNQQPNFQVLLNLTTSVAVMQADLKRMVDDLAEVKVSTRDVQALAQQHTQQFIQLEAALRSAHEFGDEDLKLIQHMLKTNREQAAKQIAFGMPMRVALIAVAAGAVFTVLTTVILNHFLK